MNKKFLKLIVKFFALTFSFLLVIFAISSVFNIFSGRDAEKFIARTNANSFENIANPIMGKTGIALVTNIGTRYKQTSDTDIQLYSDAITIGQLMQSSELSHNDSGLIENNMKIISEYKNVLKTDFKGVINGSLDRSSSLTAIISQLQYRHELAVSQMRSLVNQRTSLEGELKTLDTTITLLKNKITSAYGVGDSQIIYESVDALVKLREQYEYARTYVVLTNQFLSDYGALNNYTANLLSVLGNNKDAIIKDSYVVIPSEGAELLRDFDLLYNEGETIN